MRFTAEISCFQSTNGLEESQQRHFESDDIVATVTIIRPKKRSLSVPPSSSSRKVSAKKSLSRISEEEMMELYKMSFGGQRPKSSRAAAEEEEIRRKMVRKPSRKISREGDYLLIQEKIGVLMSQTGAQQIKETRVLIDSDEYHHVIKSMKI